MCRLTDSPSPFDPESSFRMYHTMVTIAGSDSGAGAGIQADIKTASALDVYAMTVVTAVTAQNSMFVKSVYPIPAEEIHAQLDAVGEECLPDAVKIGMISDSEGMKTIADFLKEKKWGNIVVDPVLRATSGMSLSDPENVDVYKRLLFPLATLVTPNIPEAEILTGMDIRSFDDIRKAAYVILRMMSIGGEERDSSQIGGARGVLLKGGHRVDNGECHDLLVYTDGVGIREQIFTHEYIHTSHTHGTGCTLSSAIASYFAKGLSLVEACEYGIDYLLQSIERGAVCQLGFSNESGPLKHF